MKKINTDLFIFSKNNKIQISHLQFIILKLRRKYNSPQDFYMKKKIEELIFNDSSLYSARFKEFLIYEDDTEFLRRFYKKDETNKKLKHILYFYEKYSKIFPNYTVVESSKYMYKNIQKKQKMIDNLQEIKNQENYNKSHPKNYSNIFNTTAMDSILNESNSFYQKNLLHLFNLTNENINNNSVNDSFEETLNDFNKVISYIDNAEDLINSGRTFSPNPKQVNLILKKELNKIHINSKEYKAVKNINNNISNNVSKIKLNNNNNNYNYNNYNQNILQKILNFTSYNIKNDNSKNISYKINNFQNDSVISPKKSINKNLISTSAVTNNSSLMNGNNNNNNVNASINNNKIKSKNKYVLNKKFIEQNLNYIDKNYIKSKILAMENMNLKNNYLSKDSNNNKQNNLLNSFNNFSSKVGFKYHQKNNSTNINFMSNYNSNNVSNNNTDINHQMMSLSFYKNNSNSVAISSRKNFNKSKTRLPSSKNNINNHSKHKSINNIDLKNSTTYINYKTPRGGDYLTNRNYNNKKINELHKIYLGNNNNNNNNILSNLKINNFSPSLNNNNKRNAIHGFNNNNLLSNIPKGAKTNRNLKMSYKDIFINNHNRFSNNSKSPINSTKSPNSNNNKASKQHANGSKSPINSTKSVIPQKGKIGTHNIIRHVKNNSQNINYVLNHKYSKKGL